MAWNPDPNLSSLVARILQQHQERALVEMRDLAARIANRRSGDGTLRGGNHVVEVRDAHIARVREYAETVTREVVELVSGTDGTLDPDAAAWIRGQLEPQLMAMASGIAEAIETSPAIRGLEGDPKEGARRALRESVTMFADRLKLGLGIALDKAVVRSAAATRAKRSDPALADVLVPLPGRRAYDADLPEAIAAAQAEQEPLALVAFDIDSFKSVNDDHGGHATGDAALIEVAKLADACVRGKGTAYRLSGDEFVMILPNHAAHEAVAVAERLRRTVTSVRLPRGS
jgi:diguanylate cyclase (GGDEF)-like protein